MIKAQELEYTMKLGGGASGKVYKGLYRGGKVAIKVLKADPSSVKEFMKEFSVMSVITCQHIIKIIGVSLDPKMCIVMEYCSRGSLFHVLSNPKYNIDWTKGIRWMAETTIGLNHLHTLKPNPVFHRDMKSLNVLISENWEVRLIDFGLARFSTADNAETMKNVVGTISWTAPELLRNSLYGTGELFTTKSDVYSLGVIFWEVATRVIRGQYQRPYFEYPFTMDFQIIVQAADHQLRPTIPSDCCSRLSALITKCWDNDPVARPECNQILEELHALNEHCQQHPELWPCAPPTLLEARTLSRDGSANPNLQPLGHIVSDNK